MDNGVTLSPWLCDNSLMNDTNNGTADNISSTLCVLFDLERDNVSEVPDNTSATIFPSTPGGDYPALQTIVNYLTWYYMPVLVVGKKIYTYLIFSMEIYNMLKVSASFLTT